MRLFSTEQVSKYHPDKYADQISDAILDVCLEKDKNARVACETMVKDGVVIFAGEISTQISEDEIYAAADKVAAKLGYKIHLFHNYLGQQSPEIAGAVNTPVEIGAGDQGMMVGYATRETKSMLPYGFDLANRIVKAIEWDVDNNPDTILKGDAKAQVTVDLDAPKDERSVKTILVSACHLETITSIEKVRDYVSKIIDKVIKLHSGINLLINPAGLWTIGGPFADAGLTGRKIVCDQYGGYVPVGGGAFSGKDPTKVDRSGAYAARQLAVELLKMYTKLEWVEVQIAYAIGQSEPVSISVKTNLPEVDERITQTINCKHFTPKSIIEKLQLKEIKYEKLAEGCHYYGHDR